MTAPYIGQLVHYHHGTDACIAAAIIVAVHADGSVNLTVLYDGHERHVGLPAIGRCRHIPQGIETWIGQGYWTAIEKSEDQA